MNLEDKNFIARFILIGLFLMSLFTFKVPDNLTKGVGDEIKKSASAQVLFPFKDIDDERELKKAEDIRTSIFSALDLKAKSVYVYDLSERKAIFDKNGQLPRPLASITKLMTALVVREGLEGNFYIPISKASISQDNDDGFRDSENFKRDDLISFMLVSSSNDAAHALAEFMGNGMGEGSSPVFRFIQLMNEKAQNMGMSHSGFSNPHGLDIEIDGRQVSGADGSAADIATLLSYIYERYPDMIARTRDARISIVSEEGRVITRSNTNRALGFIPQLIGSKTGFTDLAGGNLAFIFDAGYGRPVVVVLMGSTADGRFEDATKISEAILQYYQIQSN